MATSDKTTAGGTGRAATAGEASTNGEQGTQRALCWSSLQCAEAIGHTGEFLDYPVLADERMTGPLIAQLRDGWRELTGEELDPATTWNQLPIMVGSVAEHLTGTTQTRPPPGPQSTAWRTRTSSPNV